MRSKALKNKLAEQSLQDVQRFMDPGARTSNVMGTSQAKKLRAARDAMKKAGQEFSTGLDDYNMANIITNDEIAANITKDRTPPEPTKSSTTTGNLTPELRKQIALTSRQSTGGRDLPAPSPLKMRQLGATPVTQAEVDASAPKTPKAVVPQTQASSKAVEAAKKRVAARQAELDKISADLNKSGYAERLLTGRDPKTFKKDFDITSQQEIEDKLPSQLRLRQFGARPVTQAEVDFSGAFDRRVKSAAAQGRGPVSGLDFSTAVRPASKDGSEGAASTPTTVTPGAEPEAPRGFRGMAQDALKVAQDAYQDMRDQQAADFERAAPKTTSDMNRGSVFPQLTPTQIGRNVAQDAALVAPIPGVSLLGRLGKFLTKPLNTGKGSRRVVEPTVGKPATGPASNDPSFGTSRVGGDEAEAFLTGRPIPPTSRTVPDPSLGKPGTGSVPTTPGRVEPTMTSTGGDVGDVAADQIAAIQTGKVRIEPTMGPREKSVSTPPPSTTITDLLKGTQADPIPSSFAQVGTRRTQKVAAPEFKEPKNFTQLQKLYNKGEITPQQYEMYKNRFLTAESKLEYIRTMFRGA